MPESTIDVIKQALGKVLHLGDKRTSELKADTPLHGSMPELDSMAVILVLVEIEEVLDVTFNDDEVSTENFETVGALALLAQSKLNE